MSLLAAAVPVAVLVLAWDETAPAVRALMDATDAPNPALDSVVVLVPAATGEPSQEEFLPLPPALPEAADDETASSPTAPAPAEPVPALPPIAAPTPADLPPPAAPQPPTVVPSALPALGTETEANEAPPTALPPAPLAWQEVRVLRLSSFDLPELTELSNQSLPRPIWQSRVVFPSAPYLGGQPETMVSSATTSEGAPQPDVAQRLISLSDITLPVGLTLPVGPPEPPLPGPLAPAPAYLATELPLPAIDAEADLAPTAPDTLADAEAAPTEAPLAEAPSHALAGWPDALAALRTPLPIDEPAAPELEDEAAYYATTVGEAPAANAEPATPPLVSQPFEAPDLNFQVIQYARFAVPVALAQAPFAAIYAPAWPTWLAAQELRYRTRQPLVLHVTTLAAGDDQSLETATGWQAELQRQALQRADLILAETPELTRRLRHDLGLPPEVVRTVPAADAAAVAQALRTAHVRTSDSAA